MKELMENLKETCTNAKIYALFRPIAAVVPAYMMFHFLSVGGFWGIAAAIYCASMVFTAIRGYIVFIKFHMHDFYAEGEFEIM